MVAMTDTGLINAGGCSIKPAAAIIRVTYNQSVIAERVFPVL